MHMVEKVWRCDQCAHWNREADEYSDGAILNVRRCGKAIEIWNATEWNDNYDRVPIVGLEEQKMFVKDGSSYAASLLTRADFFCAHFDAALQESEDAGE